MEACDGDEAANRLDGPEGFDVLFTDVQMLGTFDGVDVAVHAPRHCPAIPVLMVSDNATNLEPRLKMLEPAVVFINKPCALDEIVKTVRRLPGKAQHG